MPTTLANPPPRYSHLLPLTHSSITFPPELPQSPEHTTLPTRAATAPTSKPAHARVRLIQSPGFSFARFNQERSPAPKNFLFRPLGATGSCESHNHPANDSTRNL